MAWVWISDFIPPFDAAVNRPVEAG